MRVARSLDESQGPSQLHGNGHGPWLDGPEVYRSITPAEMDDISFPFPWLHPQFLILQTPYPRATFPRVSQRAGEAFNLRKDQTLASSIAKASMGDKADPRMPSAARPYVAPLINPNDLPPDYSSLLAIIFGIAGVMLRVSNALPITLHCNFFLCGRMFSAVLKGISVGCLATVIPWTKIGSYRGDWNLLGLGLVKNCLETSGKEWLLIYR